jgi:hypothetical protein
VKSELQLMLERIEKECQALNNMKGYAVVSNHAAITKQFNRVGEAHDKLASVIGEKQAMEEVFEIYSKVLG